MAIPVNLISAMHKPVRNQYSNERWHFFLAFIGSLTDEMPLLKFAGLLRFKSQDRITDKREIPLKAQHHSISFKTCNFLVLKPIGSLALKAIILCWQFPRL